MTSKENILIFIIAIMLIVGAIVLLANNRIKANESAKLNSNEENIQSVQNTYNKQTVQEITNPYVIELEDGQKQNNSPTLKEEKQFKQIDITNINFVYNPGNKMTTITADLTNVGTEEQEQEVVSLRILDQNGDGIVTIEALIPNIKPKETRKLNSSVSADLSNATNFEIIEK